MTLQNRFICGGLMLMGLAQPVWGQPASAWRAFKVADGLTEAACGSVTISRQGTVLTRHLSVPLLTRLDGYGFATVPAPPTLFGRVYESPAGQLWASATNGLYEFRDDQWVLYPIPQMEAEPLHLPHGVPLHPLRQGRVLVLLYDRLIAMNAEKPDQVKIELLRSAGQTRLGTFLGMTVGHDDGLWISGVRGVARLPGPARNLRADMEWREFEPPAELRVENLREPREDESGAVTALGESVEGRDPVLVRFDGQRWSVQAIGFERVRFAWSRPGNLRWAMTGSALFWRQDDQGGWLPNEDCSARKFFDLAVERDGTFWLATADGLFRFAPPVWQTPAAALHVSGTVSGLAEDTGGRIWFLAGGEVHALHEQTHRVIAIPAWARRGLQSARSLLPLANGDLLFDAGSEWLQLQPENGQVLRVESEIGRRQIRYLGRDQDGTVISARAPDAGGEPDWQLETYDGKEFRPLALPVPQPLSVERLLAMYRARNGDWWLSGLPGVASWREGKWRTFLVNEKVAPEAAQFFSETADGRVWCATTDKLWVFDGRDWALVRMGFDRITGLVRTRDDSLWVASHGGLHRLTAAGWIENSVEEGLPSAAVRSIHEDRRGRLWAGTSAGISAFHPEADPDPPRTEILAPSDKPFPEGGSITLTFNGRDKWKFTARKRLLYSYRLDDQEWSRFQELSTVTLTDLEAGNHTFQVRAMDRNGNIESKPAHLALTVTLPWFKETRLVAVAMVASVAVLFFAALAFNRHRQLRRSYAEVERKVADRTRQLEIANRELLHSQKMTALGTLAAGVAHDFNNVLSIVKGSAQIIEDNLHNPEKIRTRVDRIKTVVEQGTGVVQAMLGFSRNSEGAMEACDLNAVVKSTITLLGDRFLRDVEVRFDCAQDLPPVEIARDLVQQILLNFVFNAAEAMSSRKQVRLRTGRVRMLPEGLVLKPADAESYAVVAVQDNGCGISPEHLPRIFEPFFTTKGLSARRGTGLGLSMVYELARRMNAGLAVESVVGVGSTFMLILPLTTVLPPANAPSNPALSLP